jgi:Flp pilus assembly pilin Flp
MLELYVRWLSLKESVLRRIRSAMTEETGATVAEYALVLVLVTVAVIGVLGRLGGALTEKIEGIITSLGGE